MNASLGEKSLKILLSSGGKESFYALMRVGKVDLALMLSYEFSRPSPHLLNMGKSVETHLKAGIPVLIRSLRKGYEEVETIETLKRLGTSEVIAGDVSVEEHLKYMERIAGEIGANLVEPLWGENPEELLHKEFEDGLRVLVIGGRRELERWLGAEVDRKNVTEFEESCRTSGVDPLGERGEYHTMVIDSPLHREKVGYQRVAVEDYGEYRILRVM